MQLQFKTIQLPYTLEPIHYYGWLLKCENFIPSELWESLYKRNLVSKDKSLKSLSDDWLYTFEAVTKIISAGHQVYIDGEKCENIPNLAETVLQKLWPEDYKKLKLQFQWKQKKEELVQQFVSLLPEGKNLGVDTKNPPRNSNFPRGWAWVELAEYYINTDTYVYEVQYVEPSHESIYPVTTTQYPLTSELYKAIKQLESHKKQSLS